MADRTGQDYRACVRLYGPDRAFAIEAGDTCERLSADLDFALLANAGMIEAISSASIREPLVETPDATVADVIETSISEERS